MTGLYEAELERPLNARPGLRGIGAQRIQEWLGLHGLGVAIDGDYGAATAHAVELFQQQSGIRPAEPGGVDDVTWRRLVAPLDRAHVASGPPFGAAVLDHAEAHLKARAREIGGDNRGPWVRHYCRGASVAWCQGFASTMYAAAAADCERPSPLDLELDGIWCLYVPRMVQEAKAKGLFVDGRGPAVPTPGSMFFLRGGPYGWPHVGLVVQVRPGGLIETIEGNTNEDGSANGYEVARRIRRIESCDFAVLPA